MEKKEMIDLVKQEQTEHLIQILGDDESMQLEDIQIIEQEAKLKHLFNNGPKIMAFVGNVNQGKSMGLSYIMKYLRDNFKFDLYSYSLKTGFGKKVSSIWEIELIENSIIIIDEFVNLFDLENHKQRKSIENTIRHIHHKNNILILAGVPENFKKFISAKIDICFFKMSTFADFTNGGRLKEIILNYKGDEAASTILDMPVDKVLLWDGNNYDILTIPYLKEYDTKKNNVPILLDKKLVKM